MLGGCVQVFWITPQGAVLDAFIYTPNCGANFELAPPGSAMQGAITCLSRAENAMEVRSMQACHFVWKCA